MTYFHLLWWKGTFVMEQSTLIANDKWSVIEILAREGMMHLLAVRTKGYSTDLLDPTQVESKKCSQIQWPVPSITAEPVDIFLGEE